jgi:hypothetical protein
MHSRGESGIAQRSPAIPDTPPEARGLVDIAILRGGSVEQVIEKMLPGLTLSIVPMKRRMGGERDKGTLSG